VPALLAWLVLPRTVSEYGVGGAEVQLTFFWILGLGGTLPFLPYFSARREDMQAYYPQVRVREWTRGLYVINSLIWIVYLGAYEFLFRGFILTGCLQTMGLWPAIAITTAISSATHMPKGPKETFGTIPFSIILCLAMAQTGAIWAGYIVHVLLALANDYFALRFKQRTSVLR
jgi:membrane protease YdiL (CAAX protease family)